MAHKVRKVAEEYGPFLAILVCALVSWEVFVRVFEVPAYLLPGPVQIGRKTISMWPILAGHALVTLKEIIIGFAVGASVGFILATTMAYSRLTERLLYPFIVVSQTFPKEALAPLLLVWLGFGIWPKVAVSALISFFPVAINTLKGLTSVEPLSVDLMRSLSATNVQIFVKLRLPSSLPYVFAALKMAITLSVIGAIVGEFVGASAGLGYLMQVGNSQLATDLTFSALLVLGAMAITLFLIMEALEGVFLRKYEKATYVNVR